MLEAKLPHRKLLNAGISCNMEIESITITNADSGKKSYRGSFVVIDHDADSKASGSWKAEPGKQVQEISGKKYFLDIKPAETYLDPEKFTQMPEIDTDLKKNILETIIEFNPELPWKK